MLAVLTLNNLLFKTYTTNKDLFIGKWEFKDLIASRCHIDN